MKKTNQKSFKKENVSSLKRFFAVTLSCVMISNLSCEVFAQIAKYDLNKFDIQRDVKKNSSLFPKYQQYQQEVAKTRVEQRRQEIAKFFGVTSESYSKQLFNYAIQENLDINSIDFNTAYKDYLDSLSLYDYEYHNLIKLFETKPFNAITAGGNYFLKQKDSFVQYKNNSYYNGDDNYYNREAFLHATLHNLITRKNTGFKQQNNFVFSGEREEEFTLEYKLQVINYIYQVVSEAGIYPADNNNIWAFAYDIVSNGEKYFDNDTYKADVTPGLANADDRMATAHGKENRQKEAYSVSSAIALLPAVSKTEEQKVKSAQVIYDLARKVMRDDYGAIAISNGAQALVALNTDDSLNKLYTLLTDDLYRGVGTRVVMFTLDSLSLEEWANRSGGIANRIKNGLGQYHNAIARRFTYIDYDKNPKDMIYLAQNNALEGLYNVVYTDIFEDIGKTIGKYSDKKGVAALANKLTEKYLDDTAKKIRSGEKKIHTSLIIGILGTAKQKNEALTKAAEIIYNGSWWDINEATQRDKNNIAAKYLNFAKKNYDEQKKQDFKTICAAKNVGRFGDIALNAVFMGALMSTLPSVIKKVSSFSTSNIKGIKLKMDPKNLKEIKPVEIKKLTQVKKLDPVDIKEIKPVPVRTKPVDPAKALQSEQYKRSAIALISDGDNLGAIDKLEEIVKLNPSEDNIALLEKTKAKAKPEEYYARALKNKKLGRKQRAYDDFEEAINKENRKAVKAQYAIEEARFLKYAKGTGNDRIVIQGNEYISYKEGALFSYDRAIEYAPNNKVRAQYLFERAQFKRLNSDFEGAMIDYQAACKLDPIYKNTPLN